MGIMKPDATIHRPDQAQAGFNNELAVVAEVLGRYYEGLYHCDTALLRMAFRPQAYYATASGGEMLQLHLDDYLPVVAARTSPASTGEPFGTDLLLSGASLRQTWNHSHSIVNKPFLHFNINTIVQFNFCQCISCDIVAKDPGIGNRHSLHSIDMQTG